LRLGEEEEEEEEEEEKKVLLRGEVAKIKRLL
jgi:hypothetical protein